MGIHFRSRGRDWDLQDYLAVNRVAGLLVLKDGHIAAEIYQYGNTPQTRWMSIWCSCRRPDTRFPCLARTRCPARRRVPWR